MTAPKSMCMHNGGKEGDLTLYMPSAFREASTPLLFSKPNPCLRLARPAGTEQETAREKRNDEARVPFTQRQMVHLTSSDCPMEETSLATGAKKVWESRPLLFPACDRRVL